MTFIITVFKYGLLRFYLLPSQVIESKHFIELSFLHRESQIALLRGWNKAASRIETTMARSWSIRVASRMPTGYGNHDRTLLRIPIIIHIKGTTLIICHLASSTSYNTHSITKLKSTFIQFLEYWTCCYVVPTFFKLK